MLPKRSHGHLSDVARGVTAWWPRRPWREPVEPFGRCVAGGPLLRICWDRLGLRLGAASAVVGLSWRVRGPLGAAGSPSSGPSSDHLRGLLGASLGPLGALLGRFGPLLGRLGGLLGRLGPMLGILGRLGARFGPSWAALGALFGLSWGALGALWGHLGALLGRLGTLLGRLVALFGASWAVCGRSGRPVEPSGAVLGPNSGEPENLQKNKENL